MVLSITYFGLQNLRATRYVLRYCYVLSTLETVEHNFIFYVSSIFQRVFCFAYCTDENQKFETIVGS